MQKFTFDNHIREIRKAKNLTLADVSAKTGVTIAYLSDIERGNRHGSSVTRRKIADVLGCTVDELKEGRADGKAV